MGITKKKTIGEFITKSIAIHGSKYDYSRFTYVTNKIKGELICHELDALGNEHGSFFITPQKHIYGVGCPKCAGFNKTTEVFVAECIKIHGDKYSYDKTTYKKSGDRVVITCPIHGDFEQQASKHLLGGGCPQCHFDSKRMVPTHILDRFNSKHNNKYTYPLLKSEYQNQSSVITIICPIHGEFKQTAVSHIIGCGCMKCANLDKGKHFTYSQQKFIDKANVIHNNKYCYDNCRYINISTKVCITCEKHGEYWQNPYKHLHGQGCPKCGNNTSKQQIEVCDFIKMNLGELGVITSTKKVLQNKKELDIYLPELKIAFEFNGLYWHSEEFVPNNYHLTKTKECEEQGIQLIHIFEDEWNYKKEIVKSRILNIIGKTPNTIYARKCAIKEVPLKEANHFLEQNHIQGKCVSKYRYGLYHNNELVSLMTFGSLRKNMGGVAKEGEFELLRFCNKLNTTIVGGASKLFKHFIKNHNPQSIISYADKRWSQGKLYEKLGFEFSGESQPNYFYVINGNREYRFNYRKDVLVREGYDSTLSEHEIMLSRGIYRIYDCGNKKYKWKKAV